MARSCFVQQRRSAWVAFLVLGAGALAAGCTSNATQTKTCFPELGYCVQNGNAVCPTDNSFVCNLPTGAPPSGSTTTTSQTGGTSTGTTSTGGTTGTPTYIQLCGFAPTATDTDGDGVPNVNERGVANNSTDPNNPDTDGDLIQDGCEDKNHNGIWELALGETNPLNKDTDSDLVHDGVEDTNHDGYFQPGETNPINADTDYDGISDGVEDSNQNGVVDQGTFAVAGCYNPPPGGTDTPSETDPRQLDTDHDGIPDGPGACVGDPNFCSNSGGGEDKNANGKFDPNTSYHETVAFAVDSDCDGITDGLEDKNKNGWVDPGETDPRNTDSDEDLIADGTEDTNHNGNWDWPAETSPILQDSDGDGIFDGVEDRNHNGKVDAWGGTGCFAYNSNQGESDPRKVDTDGDGLPDSMEDKDQNGLCGVYQNANLTNPTVFTETCAFLSDTDCDGLPEGLEDKNHNGSVDVGETNPKQQDSDLDGLTDGCPTGNHGLCEDKNNNGVLDPNETDPTNPDTDGDYESDGCELTFAANGSVTGPINPLNIDTDRDGYPDGDEDTNHNCKVDPGETDPRVYNGAPSATTTCITGSGPLNANSCLPQWDVCSPSNLGNLTFAASNRVTQNYQVALEVERKATGPCGANGACVSGETCMGNGGGADGNCVLEAAYSLLPYGKDTDGNGFSATDQNDLLYGWVFESPPGITVDPSTGAILNRDIYGFVFATEDGNNLNDVVTNLNNALLSHYAADGTISLDTATQMTPAYDSFPPDPNNNIAGFEVYYATQPYEFAFNQLYTALAIRNDLLVNVFLNGVAPQPVGTPPTTDPVYGALPSTCTASTPHCYNNFTLYVGAVQRLQQNGPTGKPVTLYVVALTPNDSDASQPTSASNRFYADRKSRLEDLTGGASVAQFNTGIGKSCDGLPQTLARADLLWVVDDSRSMQSIIQKLTLAAQAAESVLKANANIVDFRVAMTTTNASKTGRTQCLTDCDEQCQNTDPNDRSNNNCTVLCADQTLGCIKGCPSDCTLGSCNGSDVCSCSGCAGYDVCSSAGTCYGAAGMASVIAQDPNALQLPNGSSGTFNAYQLPGGGGSFYYESTFYMDCLSECQGAGPNYQESFLNHCNNTVISQMQPFYNPGNNDKVLYGNAGWHGPQNANSPQCPTWPLDLYYQVANGDSSLPNFPQECNRLADACGDGPTILASQMCDLIRAMGGVPTPDLVNDCSPGNPNSSGARRHAGAEEGSRSARRLYTNLTAYPYDSGQLAPTSMRLNCSASDGNCLPCVVGPGSTCKLVPTATVFLSDEEDYFFKDDCMEMESLTDKTQLPSDCIYNGGNGCTPTYCAQFSDGVPTGTNHDQTAWRNDSADYTLQWGNEAGGPLAPECSFDPANAATTCISDPCPFYANQTACNAAASAAHCIWVSTYTTASGSTVPSNSCMNACAFHVLDTTVETGNPAGAAAQETACSHDPLCVWQQSQVEADYQGPTSISIGAVATCQLAQPINDCAACKRYTRLQQSLAGDANLVGFNHLGAVYAITRLEGHPGMGTLLGTGLDTCAGGPLTWGRGDGQAYRDLATQTGGKTQDICAPSYQGFVEQLTADLAVLSRPYPLSAQPIPATIEVGVARQVSGAWTYVPVPRSDTQGFFYSAGNNSIGFKSDPVLGVCAPNVDCSADTTIGVNEILYAQQLPYVPTAGDLIYVSYKVWEPPIQCPAGETEARITCSPQSNSQSCNSNEDCAGGYTCSGNQCQLACTVGSLINVCLPQPNCGSCETWDPNTRSCVAAAACCNNSGQQSCNPQSSADTCPIGMACDETCVCSQIASCTGVTFGKDGTVSNCTNAIACCTQFQAAATACTGLTSSTSCTADSNCRWPGSCAATAPTSLPCSGYDQTTCTANSSVCTWTPGSGPCQYRYQTCCPSQDTVSCYTDGETGAQAIACLPQACSCLDSSGHGKCASMGPSYFCDDTQNCQCVPIGN